MKNEKLISVIVPIYNNQKYISECINSIQAQLYKCFEIILVDDGSCDESGIICDRLALEYSNIIVLHTLNKGPSNARNSGVDIGNGEYFAFVDSDDVVNKLFLYNLFEAVTDSNVSVGVCKFKTFDNIEKIMSFSGNKKAKYNLLSSDVAMREICMNGNKELVVIWSKLYKKDIFNRIRFRTDQIVGEDEIFATQLFSEEKSICCLEDDLYYYRINSDGLTFSGFSKSKLDALAAHEFRIEYLTSHSLFVDCINPEILSYLYCMIRLFFEARESDNKEIAKTLRAKYIRNLHKVNFSLIRKKDAFWLVLFRISPYLYNKVYSRNRNKNREIAY